MQLWVDSWSHYYQNHGNSNNRDKIALHFVVCWISLVVHTVYAIHKSIANHRAGQWLQSIQTRQTL